MFILMTKKKYFNFISLPLIIKKKKFSNFRFKNIFFLLKYFSINDILLKIDFRFYYRIKRLAKKIRIYFAFIRRLRLKLSLNKLKFEQIFIQKLIQYLSKYYGKKVELNIVNLKSLANNSDIFTEILTLKLKKEKSNAMYRINALLSRVNLPKVNTIIERGRIEKQVDYELIENKYRNLNVSSIINKTSEHKLSLAPRDDLNKLLYNIHYKPIMESSDKKMKSLTTVSRASASLKKKLLQNSKISKSTSHLNKAYYLKLRNIIFENINYKNMGGAKLIVKGRLTRRYRADRALFKYKWKGGLKNIDSAFKGLSSVVFRGYLDSNVEKSRSNSKRRIGSFGVRSWLSGK